MNVIIFGATGMVGQGVLLECLEDPSVARVLLVSRRSAGVNHPKVEEAIRQDFYDFSDLQGRWSDYDACFFCLGVTSVGLDEATYRRLTFDLTLAAARSMAAAKPGMTFCYVTGLGTDGTAKGRVMWARVKGETENAILALPFKAAYMFRPGYIQPLKGVRSKTAWYDAVYKVAWPLYPPLRRLAPGFFTDTVTIARAMLNVVTRGYPRPVLEGRDINQAGA